MNADLVLSLIVGAVLVVAVGLLATAFVGTRSTGRVRPVHPVLWVIGVIILGINTLLHVAATTAAALAEPGFTGWWLAIGTVGFAAVLALAFLRPRWAGWVAIGSGLIVPVLIAVGNIVVSGDVSEGQITAPVAVPFATVPALITGTLLVLSTYRLRRHESPGAAAPAAG